MRFPTNRQKISDMHAADTLPWNIFYYVLLKYRTEKAKNFRTLSITTTNNNK